MRKIYRLFALACIGAVVLAACSNKSKSEATAEGGAACADAPAAFVEAEGVRLHYTERGDGPPVIMIHGASSNLCDLDLALAEDAAAFRRVILFDRPGLGRSGRPKGGHDPRTQARLLHTAAEKLGAEKPILLAHSLGGAVALAYALQYPDDVSGLLLLAPVSHPWPGGVTWYNDVAAAPVIGPLFRWLIVPWAGPLVANREIDGALPADYYDRAAVKLLMRPRTFKANAKDLTKLKPIVAEMSQDYGDISAPIVILTGEDDTTVGPTIHSEALAKQAPNAKLTLYPGVKHFIQHERAPEIIEALRTFPEPSRLSDASSP